MVELVDEDTKYGTAKSMKGIEEIIKMSDLITEINTHQTSQLQKTSFEIASNQKWFVPISVKFPY